MTKAETEKNNLKFKAGRDVKYQYDGVTLFGNVSTNDKYFPKLELIRYDTNKVESYDKHEVVLEACKPREVDLFILKNAPTTIKYR